MADPENTLVLETTKGTVEIALRPDLAAPVVGVDVHTSTPLPPEHPAVF